MAFMVFWTWAKGLEDRFDGANRRNLRRFIVAKDSDNASDGVVFQLPARNSVQSTNEEVGPAIHYAETHRIENEDRPESLKFDGKLENYYYMAPGRGDRTPSDEKNGSFEQEEEERRELVRISTCAIFHKLSAGTGVPHSFVGESLLLVLA
jgi:KUP system potassium uptake protein